MADKIGAPRSWLPVIRRGLDDDAYYYIEINAEGLNLVYKDRGVQSFRGITDDPDELLYQIVERITGAVAIRFELEHRVKGQDSRRIRFKKQEDLLGELNPAWGEKCRKYHEVI